jgi:hypothetical protein
MHANQPCGMANLQSPRNGRRLEEAVPDGPDLSGYEGDSGDLISPLTGPEAIPRHRRALI